MALWVIRILFLILCTIGGYAVSQVREEVVGVPYSGPLGMIIGFGFGWLMIAIDEMLKGFSLRAFSATTFGLILGTVVALVLVRELGPVLTALMVAAGFESSTTEKDGKAKEERNHQEIVRSLLNAGADWHSKDSQGQTAYDLALKAGHKGIADLIIDTTVR